MDALYQLSYVGTDLESYRPASADRTILRRFRQRSRPLQSESVRAGRAGEENLGEGISSERFAALRGRGPTRQLR
jgi:hypothetical protein